MKSGRYGALLTLLLIPGLGASPGWAMEPVEGRYALILGNSAYGGEPVSGVRDAEAMAGALREIGFTVLDPVLDGNLERMRHGLEALRGRLAHASVVLVFYSGHGFQLGAANYLLPVDGAVSPDRALPLEDISRTLAFAPDDAVKLVFLDTCRNLESLPPGAAQNLTEMPDPPRRTLYAFATGSGRTAASGTSGTPREISPYTEALVRLIREPGLEVRDLLARLYADVTLRTGGRQSPTELGLSHLPVRFFLREPVLVSAKIESADDSLVVLLNGENVLQSSDDQETSQSELRDGRVDIARP